MITNKSKVISTIVIFVLLFGNIVFGVKYFLAQKEIKKMEDVIKARQINEKTLNFTRIFVVKILKAEKEVDFETRLMLENSVRDLENSEILAQWQKFTNSKTESEAQEEVKILLEMLVNKIKI